MGSSRRGRPEKWAREKAREEAFQANEPATQTVDKPSQDMAMDTEVTGALRRTRQQAARRARKRARAREDAQNGVVKDSIQIAEELKLRKAKREKKKERRRLAALKKPSAAVGPSGPNQHETHRYPFRKGGKGGPFRLNPGLDERYFDSGTDLLNLSVESARSTYHDLGEAHFRPIGNGNNYAQPKESALGSPIPIEPTLQSGLPREETSLSDAVLSNMFSNCLHLTAVAHGGEGASSG